MATPKAPTDKYTDLSVYDRTFIETVQSLINSGKYAPGPLIMEIAREATNAMMFELGFATTQPVFRTDFWKAQGR